MHPTRVEVYSDNHGEAMAYLNGDFNLVLTQFNSNGAANIQPGHVVGSTIVRAEAIYPYVHLPKTIISGNVTKTWTWDGIVLGPDATPVGGHKYVDNGATEYWPAGGYFGVNSARMVLSTGSISNETGSWPNQLAYSNKKAIWVWVCDRDGKQAGVLGDRVQWDISITQGVAGVVPQISGVDTNGAGMNDYNVVTKGIQLIDGFLAGTNGIVTDVYGYQGVSYLIDPTVGPKLPATDTGRNGVSGANLYVGKTALEALFYKFYNPTMKTADQGGLQPCNFAVAMIEVMDMSGTASGAFNVTERIFSNEYSVSGTGIATLVYATNCEFAYQDPEDDAPRYGDANLDGAVNMGDVTTIERMILGLAFANVNADANVSNSIDMGDVVRVERQILGY